MKLAGKRSVWLEYLVIFLGTGLMATAIKACFDACGLVTGGSVSYTHLTLPTKA